MMNLNTETPIRDQIIAGAKSAPELLAVAQIVDPAMAASLTPKALIASKTPWGTLACSAIGWLVTKYGMACTSAVATKCWTPEDVNLAAGLVAMLGAVVGSYLMRFVSSSPIAGVFKVMPAPVAAAVAPAQGPGSVVTIPPPAA